MFQKICSAALALVVTVAAWAQDFPPQPPANVQATDGMFCDRVRVTWNASAGATSYQVFRSTVNSSGTASQIGSIAGTTFNDTSASVLTTYWYWVKATDGTGQSGFSVSDDGFRNATPAPVTNVMASDDTFCDKVLVNWDGTPGATSYNVYRATNTTFANAIFIGSSTSSSLSDTSAITLQQYYYWVRAVSPCGMSNQTGPDGGRRGGGPSAPTGVSASNGIFCDFVRVEWNAIPSATEYEVYRASTNNAQASTLIGTTPSASFDDTSSAPLDTMWYFVKAKDTCGTSPFSTGDSGFSLGVPSPVSGVSATDGTLCAKVTITWGAVAGATSYIVDRATTSNYANSTAIAFVTQNTYTDNTVAGAQTYYYWVRAGSICGQSAPSGPDTGYAATTPQAPTGLVSSGGAVCDRISISWDAAPATSFVVYRSETSSLAQATQVAEVSGCFFDDAVTPDVTYYYWVAGKSNCGTSPFAGPVSGIATLDCPLAVYGTGFEPTVYTGSFAGVSAHGVDNWYNPIPVGASWSVFTPPGVLNYPAGPGTQTQFIAGVREGASTGSRLERLVWTSISSKRIVEFDLATNFIATPPADSLIGFVSLHPNTTARGFRILYNWANPSSPSAWSMSLDVYDASGAPTLITPAALNGTLMKQMWYRVRTILDVFENRVTRVTVLSPTGAVVADMEPEGWYLGGGANPTLPFAELFRVAAVGDSPTSPNFGNSVALDNFMIYDPEYQTDFESFVGSECGLLMASQGAWYNDSGSEDLRVHDDPAALGIGPNPTGGSTFVSALASSGEDAEIFRNLRLDAGSAYRFGADVAAGRGQAGSANEILGRWLLGPYGSSAAFRISPVWDSPATPNKWSLRFDVSDAAGATFTATPAGAGLGLSRDKWYRVEVLVDFPNNRLLEFSVTDLATGAVTTEVVAGWYLRGGAGGGLTVPNRIGLIALSQGSGGNRLSYDNVTLVPEDACYPDCDGSGTLDFFDYLCFNNAFATQNPFADCDGNGVFDFFDYLCFNNAYAGGCP